MLSKLGRRLWFSNLLRAYLPSIFERISLNFFDGIGRCCFSLSSEVLVLDLGAGVLDFDGCPFGRVFDDLNRIVEERSSSLAQYS